MEDVLTLVLFVVVFQVLRPLALLYRIIVALIGALFVTTLLLRITANLATALDQIPLFLLLALLALVIAVYLWGRKVLDDAQIFPRRQ